MTQNMTGSCGVGSGLVRATAEAIWHFNASVRSLPVATVSVVDSLRQAYAVFGLDAQQFETNGYSHLIFLFTSRPLSRSYVTVCYCGLARVNLIF